MRNWFRMAVAVGLAFALCVGGSTAFAAGKNGVNPILTQGKHKELNTTAVTGLTIALLDWEGKTVSPDAGTGVYTTVSKHRYAAKVTVAPSDANPTMRWKSNKPGVASVNDRGVITFGRPGTAVITATSKYGGVTASVTIVVSANQSVISTSADKKANKIYLRGNELYVDVVIVNSTDATITRIADQEIFLKMAGESTYTSMGVKRGKLKAPIAAGATGTATFRVKRVNPARIWLLNADAYCQAAT